MFLDFYHLRQQPFGVTPDPAYLYLSPTHREALDSLLSGIKDGRGFFALIAEPGMGKTTLLYQLLDELHDSARTVFLFQTQCNSREFFQYLLNELGVDTKGMDLVTMHGRLNEILFAEMIAGRRFVLIVDEAQNLEDSVLETVRLLSNFETSYSKMLQIVLAGQPQLSDKLAQPKLAQLRQRLAVRARLDPLSSAETAKYVEHRLTVAGYSGNPLFTPEAMALIAKRSQGVPRSINHLCYGALAAAYSKGIETVTPEIVEETASKLGFEIVPETAVAAIAAPVAPNVAPSVAHAIAPTVAPAITSTVSAHLVTGTDPPEADQLEIASPEAAGPEVSQLENVQPEVEQLEVEQLENVQLEVDQPEAEQLEVQQLENAQLEVDQPEVEQLENSQLENGQLEIDQPEIGQPEAAPAVEAPVAAAQTTADDDVFQPTVQYSAPKAPVQAVFAAPPQRRGFTLSYEPEKRFQFPRWASKALLLAGILVLGGFSLTAFMLRLGVSEEEKTPKLSPASQPPPSAGTIPSAMTRDTVSAPLQPATVSVPAQATLPLRPTPSAGATPSVVEAKSESHPIQPVLPAPPQPQKFSSAGYIANPENVKSSAQSSLPVPAQAQNRASANYTANPQDVPAGQAITVAAMPGQTVEDISRLYVGRYDPELLRKIHQLNPELTNPIQLQPGQLIRLPMPAGSFRKGKSFTPDE